MSHLIPKHIWNTLQQMPFTIDLLNEKKKPDYEMEPL